jgi:hypothetical protein
MLGARCTDLIFAFDTASNACNETEFNPLKSEVIFKIQLLLALLQNSMRLHYEELLLADIACSETVTV